VAAPAGVYSVGDVPPDGSLVHSLEHGYMIVWYRPDVAQDMARAAQDVASAFPRDTLVVPRASMSVPLAATAWHHRLLCTQADEAALAHFTDQWRNKGPERIPH
jgi:hypothetical protein